jgi:hypothetical protein
MSKEGTKYISSNTIGFSISIPKSIWLIFLSMMNGIVFGTVILFFDLSGFWLLAVKILFAFACVQITRYVVKAMKNRNRKLTYVVAILVSLISWYCMWAMNLSDFEEINYVKALSSPLHMLILFCKVQQYEGAFFLPDTLAFFLSIIIVYDNPGDVIGLFCENCKSYYQLKPLFFFDADSFLKELDQSPPGKYHFITKYDTVIADEFFDTIVKEDIPYNYIFLQLFTCEKCPNESLLTIQKVVKRYEIKKDGDSELCTDYVPTDIVHVYIDKETEDIIMEKYKQAKMKTGIKNFYQKNENANASN